MQFNHWAGRVEREQERRVRNRRERARQNRRRCDARRKRLRFELLEDRVLLASVYPAKLLFTGEPTAQTTGNAYVYTRAYPDDGLGLVSFACFGGIAANQEVGNLATVQCNGSGITVTTEPRPGSEFGEPIRLRFETVAVAGAVDHPGAPGGMANYSHTSSAPNSGGTLLQGSRSGASWLLPEQSAEMTVETTIGASFSIGFGVNGSVQTAPHTYQSVGLGFSMFYYVSIETFATLPVVSITDVQNPRETMDRPNSSSRFHSRSHPRPNCRSRSTTTLRTTTSACQTGLHLTVSAVHPWTAVRFQTSTRPTGSSRSRPEGR